MTSHDEDLYRLLEPQEVAPDFRLSKLYKYQPLKSERHIRLLCITNWSSIEATRSHAEAQDELPAPRYDIVQVDLDQSSQYQTVSYTWGCPDLTHFICLLDNDKALPITKSLSVALPHLVRFSRLGLLWIDQVCIDQMKVRERSHQVGLMGQIYGAAQGVLIWVGPDARDLRETIAAYHLNGKLIMDEFFPRCSHYWIGLGSSVRGSFKEPFRPGRQPSSLDLSELSSTSSFGRFLV
jgi:Heterokaryon incompatibility protein (HET)